MTESYGTLTLIHKDKNGKVVGKYDRDYQIVDNGIEGMAGRLKRKWYQHIWPWSRKFGFDYIVIGTDKKDKE